MKSSLIKAISVQWDLWEGPLRAFFPTGEEDIRDCQRLAREAGTLDGALPDDAFQGINSLPAACQDTRNGELHACLHLSDARQVATIAGKASQYCLDLFSPEQRNRLSVLFQLAIHPAHEKSGAALLLLSHCFVEVLKAGGRAVIMSCDPGHFPLYKRLGMRPLGSLGQTTEGLFRIPMIFIPDREYLTLIQSPVLRLMRGVDFHAYQSICQWYYQLVREQPGLRTTAAYYPEDEADLTGRPAILEGLSESGRETFLKKAMVVKCKEGEVLINENDGGKSFGYVQRGMAKVVIRDKAVVLLGEGDIFGEIAYILNSKRTARVVAASPDTEVVLFSESAIDQLRSEADKAAVWRNLARVLAQRVILTNKLLE